MRYHYLISGITIATDIHFPELEKSPHLPEVELSYADVPRHLEYSAVNFPLVEANENEYLLTIPLIARYFVKNGNKITIQPQKEAAPEEVTKYVLTAIIGALSYMKGFIPIHGGAFVKDDKAIIISGPSAAGKSSLLAALNQQGYTIIADDLCNVKLLDGKAMLYPGFQRLMIWKDTLLKLNINENTAVKLRSDMEKYLIPLINPSSTQPIEVSEMVILAQEIQEDNALLLKGKDRVTAMRANLYHPWMANTLRNGNTCYQQLMAIAPQLKMRLFKNNRSIELKTLAHSLIHTITSNAE